MSRRAAARRYEISKSVTIKWLERVERDGSREAVGHGGHRTSKLMPHRDFLEAARAEKSDIAWGAKDHHAFKAAANGCIEQLELNSRS